MGPVTSSPSTTASRLAFTTLGIPGVPLAEVGELARRTGWLGVELRSAPDEPVHVGLDDAAIEAARTDLAGVHIIATNSYVRSATAKQGDEEVVEAALAEAELARRLGTGAVRVFPGADAEPGTAEHAEREQAMVRRLRAAAERLPDGVELWLETHDSHRTGVEIARVLSAVDHPRVRAIWDIAHPPKSGEVWAATLAHLRPFLAHVQIKDELPGRVPLFLGDGDVPVVEVVTALESDGYTGWYSLEYELKWHPEAPPLAEALERGSAWWAAQGL